jgi:hypothetical protein
MAHVPFIDRVEDDSGVDETGKKTTGNEDKKDVTKRAR